MGDALACAYGQMGKEKLRLDMAEGLIWVAESLRWRLDQLACGAITAFADDGGGDNLVERFWVYFPAAREVLHQAKAFNRKNTSRPISFDHLLNSRRFNSLIYKEENVQGDRAVKEYISENAFMQLLESDRIKEQIRNIEIDLWNY